ncbi:hypothetical protein DOTSEDRAFT_52416 [Dothistroma septosporum NZE10]|uniref:Enoyl reductase (ER) domain-containing protein n=1 Tax=Dothistroma septosporum (strain NZE10 / CBS 128990) TaxID=675120 RepID=N1PQ15_DOTSN|nr:hypothetical protein DOTSEDRAFT_52416 [Dothistroma septosporum NZE10]
MALPLPSTMRASQWTTNANGIERDMKLNKEAPLPKTATSLPAGHTLVKVVYSAVNPFDYKVAETPVIGQYVLAKPSIPGLDFAGTVVDTKRSDLKVGDCVFGRTDPPVFGCLADYVVAKEQGVFAVPEGVSLRDASTAGIAALAAFQSITPFVRPGDEVFINGGSGGAGHFGIQFAKAAGCRVTTTCSSPNVTFCRNLGADEVIDYTEVDLIHHLKQCGKQYHLIVDNVFSNRNLYWQCRHYLKPEGTFATPGDTKPAALKDIGLALVLPSWLGGGQRSFAFIRNQPNQKDFEQIAKWMQQGKVKPFIQEEFSLDDAHKAYEKLKSGRTRGKIVVQVAGE